MPPASRNLRYQRFYILMNGNAHSKKSPVKTHRGNVFDRGFKGSTTSPIQALGNLKKFITLLVALVTWLLAVPMRKKSFPGPEVLVLVKSEVDLRPLL